MNLFLLSTRNKWLQRRINKTTAHLCQSDKYLEEANLLFSGKVFFWKFMKTSQNQMPDVIQRYQQVMKIFS